MMVFVIFSFLMVMVNFVRERLKPATAAREHAFALATFVVRAGRSTAWTILRRIRNRQRGHRLDRFRVDNPFAISELLLDREACIWIGQERVVERRRVIDLR